ncbi:hypothetical protein BJ875DRAFT_514129 [Amylocarpus encephaloides]|uniref:BTB domain-containing protein n=1 Tax=Amylocarpus encephaloides TaxID=45428 RepID=A0A9P7YG81_9HELO|nr:hypothetical protein BJ875DRAFT_514129 [Amylocarpus encephaloides]
MSTTPPKKKMKLAEEITFSSLTVIMGSTREVFHVRKDLVCLQSKFFDKACKQGWASGSENTVTLEDVAARAFKDFASFLRTGKSPNRTRKIHPNQECQAT